MLNLFKRNEKSKLQKQYRKLMKEAFDLSKIDRKKADAKYAEADKIMTMLQAN